MVTHKTQSCHMWLIYIHIQIIQHVCMYVCTMYVHMIRIFFNCFIYNWQGTSNGHKNILKIAAACFMIFLSTALSWWYKNLLPFCLEFTQPMNTESSYWNSHSLGSISIFAFLLMIKTISLPPMLLIYTKVPQKTSRANHPIWRQR